MSLFLGKIHHWLFNKILWFEELEDEIIELAKTEGLDTNKLKSEINFKYKEKLENKNLEEIIDINNIHGWLQDRIHSSEGRMASWIYYLLKNDKDSLSKIMDIYIQQGRKASEEVQSKEDIISAKQIYNILNDYILDGMPCDRINEVKTSQDSLVKWNRRICVHKNIWESENVDVKIFYDLRNLWIEAFVNGINNNFEYSQLGDGDYMIKRK